MTVVTRPVGADPLLLAGTRSAVEAVAATRLSSVPLAGIVTTTENVRVAPAASEAMTGQVTTWPAAVPPAVALTNVAVAGRVSVTTTLVAASGPLLVTEIE